MLIRQKFNINKISEFYERKLVLLSVKSLNWSYKNTLKRITEIRDNTFYFSDITDIYKEDAFFPDRHPNKKGYGLVAQSVFEYLKNSKLINCDQH